MKPGAGFGASNGGPRRLPSYMWNESTDTGLAGHAAPFYFPLRALTVDGKGNGNVLTAGKTIAMSFAANTAAREHLDEWSCGVASGAAAAMMATRGWSSSELLDNVVELQELLRSEAIGQPLEWGGTKPAPHGDPNKWKFRCGLGRCFSVPGAGGHNNSGCDGECPPLATQEWLANSAYWRKDNATTISARVPTVLKKSELLGAKLPPEQRLNVEQGFVCQLHGSGEPAGGYYLCSVPA